MWEPPWGIFRKVDGLIPGISMDFGAIDRMYLLISNYYTQKNIRYDYTSDHAYVCVAELRYSWSKSRTVKHIFKSVLNIAIVDIFNMLFISTQPIDILF